MFKHNPAVQERDRHCSGKGQRGQSSVSPESLILPFEQFHHLPFPFNITCWDLDFSEAKEAYLEFAGNFQGMAVEGTIMKGLLLCSLDLV